MNGATVVRAETSCEQPGLSRPFFAMISGHGALRKGGIGIKTYFPRLSSRSCLSSRSPTS